jgi:hypothetical protein
VCGIGQQKSPQGRIPRGLGGDGEIFDANHVNRRKIHGQKIASECGTNGNIFLNDSLQTSAADIYRYWCIYKVML